ncbi:prepilin-type N-terminal cleavage/methylation domain-containing protein [Pseudomonas sp. C27(2019)]|uniref:GspH/FimT family pseudopilin n=1 Tax=Pseudomonas sp. C27(2019) TaxID=2604941 RepID=UPI0012491D57|nr:GspH/FimT family pseudopilin [Pseudomonas sp. C27(2019)]QEY59683.1 prepilin-type N-terminal cleavage/methylation domain-containing protein [Pseudomonas sp. C27(2019)]
MNDQRAFTLVEMCIVLALLAILAQVALPAFQDFLERNQQQALYNQIARAVNHARTHAVTHRVRVELCGTHDGRSCNKDWSQGWLLREVNQLQPIAVTQLKTDRRRLQWSGFQAKIQFHSNGISPTGNGRFYSCHKQEISWQLILNRQGRLRSASSTENAEQIARCS